MPLPTKADHHTFLLLNSSFLGPASDGFKSLPTTLMKPLQLKLGKLLSFAPNGTLQVMQEALTVDFQKYLDECLKKVVVSCLWYVLYCGACCIVVLVLSSNCSCILHSISNTAGNRVVVS